MPYKLLYLYCSNKEIDKSLNLSSINYWKKEHIKKNPKDVELRNKQLEVDTELNKIENYILNAFNETDINEVTKDWLKIQMALYYNPVQEIIKEAIPAYLVDYIPYYLEARKHEMRQTSITKYNVIKSKLQRFEASAKYDAQRIRIY